MAAGAIPPPLFFEQLWSSDSTGLRAALVFGQYRSSGSTDPRGAALFVE
jgi:hypothetical protein